MNPKTLIGASKPDLSLIPPAALLHLASAMMDGASKYGPYNWRDNAVECMTYISGAMRHLNQFLDGEDYDPVSLCHHIGHLMANSAILLDAIEHGNLIDNRPKASAAGELIRLFKPDTKFTDRSQYNPKKCPDPLLVP